MYRARSVIGSYPVCRILVRNGSWFNRSEPSRMDKFLAKKRSWLPMTGKKYTSSPAPEESTVPKFEQEDKFHNRPTGYTIANKFEEMVLLFANNSKGVSVSIHSLYSLNSGRHSNKRMNKRAYEYPQAYQKAWRPSQLSWNMLREFLKGIECINISAKNF